MEQNINKQASVRSVLSVKSAIQTIIISFGTKGVNKYSEKFVIN